jgi:hypothetical protein
MHNRAVSLPWLMVARSGRPTPRCERGRLWAGRLAVRNPINDLRLMIGPCSPNQYPLDPNDELPGDIGAAFAVSVGIAMSVTKARAAISVFMTHLHIWTVGPAFVHLCSNRSACTCVEEGGSAGADAL